MLDAYDWENDPGQAALPRVLPKVAKRAARHIVPLERVEHQALVRWLRAVLPLDNIVQCVKNEAEPKSKDPRARARFHAKRKADGFEWGFPDLLCLWPIRKGALVEVKRKLTGVVSDRQDGMHGRIRACGWPVVVADGIETARWAFRELGIPLRETPGQPAWPCEAKVERSKRLTSDLVPL